VLLLVVAFSLNRGHLSSGEAVQFPGTTALGESRERWQALSSTRSLHSTVCAKNQALEAKNQAQQAKNQAQAVATELISRRVPADRLQPVGRGKSYPVATNETPAGRQQNRRVEIIFSDASGRFAQGAASQPVLR
jgi:hypothetical protein